MVAIAATPEAVQLVHEGIRTLAQVERNGIMVNVPYLKEAINDTHEQVKHLEHQLKSDRIWDIWRERFGRKANIGSKSQLETVIFEEMGGKYERSGRTTDSGEYSADEMAFEKVKKKCPFVARYFEREKLSKALGTYLKGIERELVGEWFYPIIDLHTAITYRSSAQRPNIQNFPVRFAAIAEIIRKCIIAPKGYRIGEIDYSGIEVCGSACYHKDPRMIKYIENPESNMHLDMAVQLFKMSKDEIGKRVRNTAKNGFVFPEFYGSWYEDCAASMWDTMEILDLRTGKEEDGQTLRKHLKSVGLGSLEKFTKHCEAIEKDMWDVRFKVYKQWKYDWWDLYVRRGWFKFYTGFVSQGLYNRKQVCNSPIQGDSFHMLLWAMIKLQKWLAKNKLKSRIIAEIHDSLLMYFHNKEVDYVLEKAHQIMTQDIRKHWKWIIVPMSIEAEIAPKGGSWFDKLKYEFTN